MRADGCFTVQACNILTWTKVSTTCYVYLITQTTGAGHLHVCRMVKLSLGTSELMHYTHLKDLEPLLFFNFYF